MEYFVFMEKFKYANCIKIFIQDYKVNKKYNNHKNTLLNKKLQKNQKNLPFV